MEMRTAGPFSPQYLAHGAKFRIGADLGRVQLHICPAELSVLGTATSQIASRLDPLLLEFVSDTDPQPEMFDPRPPPMGCVVSRARAVHASRARVRAHVPRVRMCNALTLEAALL